MADPRAAGLCGGSGPLCHLSVYHIVYLESSCVALSSNAAAEASGTLGGSGSLLVIHPFVAALSHPAFAEEARACVCVSSARARLGGEAHIASRRFVCEWCDVRRALRCGTSEAPAPACCCRTPALLWASSRASSGAATGGGSPRGRQVARSRCAAVLAHLPCAKPCGQTGGTEPLKSSCIDNQFWRLASPLAVDQPTRQPPMPNTWQKDPRFSAYPREGRSPKLCSSNLRKEPSTPSASLAARRRL